MKKFMKRAADWLYPRRCALCDRPLGRLEEGICGRCAMRKMQPIGEPRCARCGKPLEEDWREYCADCEEHAPVFDRGMGLFLYREPLKSSLMRFKFHGRREYGAYYGRLMRRYGAGFIAHCRPEVVIPVPVHRQRYRRRGYNQAEILARQLAVPLGLAVRTDLVRRKKITRAQKELNRQERAKNLRRAFEVLPEAGRYGSVLIVDDIYTTGSTVRAIAAGLKAAGVKKVYFLSLCMGKGL